MPASKVRNLELEARALMALDEDAQRVYADWLQSIGDPRGELISLELHRKDAFLSERKALASQIAEREAEYRQRWDAWAAQRSIAPSHIRLRQGFVIDLGLSLGELRDHLGPLFGREPIQRLTITDADEDGLAKLCQDHANPLGRLRYLKVQGALGPEATAALATVPFGRLERLNLLGTGLTSEACEGLASLGAPKLAHLTLTANEIDDGGVDTLLQNPWRSGWRELYLSSNPIGAKGLTAIAKDRMLEVLEGLFVAEIEASIADFEALLSDGSIPACELVELSSYGSWRHRDLLKKLRERFPKLTLR